MPSVYRYVILWFSFAACLVASSHLFAGQEATEPMTINSLPRGATPASPSVPANTGTPKAMPLDVDALAARLPKRLHIYQTVRDEAIQAYAKRQPVPSPEDAKMRELLSLFAYLITYDDCYGESLYQIGALDAWDGLHHKIDYPLTSTFIGIRRTHADLHALTDRAVQMESDDFSQFFATDYPWQLKLRAAEAGLYDLVDHSVDKQANPNEKCFEAIPRFTEEWGKDYQKAIEAKWSHSMLYDYGASMLYRAKPNMDVLNRVIAEIDRAFNEADSTNPVKLELDAAYFIEAAWNARGGDFAPKVPNVAWPLMADRLDKADAILEPLYDRFPGEIGTCLEMMTVELGQAQGRKRMELWYQRAVQIDPTDPRPYHSKMWYLQPRWYGSTDDILEFSKDCVAAGKTAPLIELEVATAISDVAHLDPSVYDDPKVWPLVQLVYCEYLQQFPTARSIRTRFARQAYAANRLAIAAEQLAILGKLWDRDVISEQEHASMMPKLAQSNAARATAIPPAAPPPDSGQ